MLGTGLGQLASEITDTYEFPYSEIPNFPVSTVEGHSGKLIFGRLGGKDIVANHCGIRVFGISIVTDLGGFDVPVEVSHEEVQIAANKAQPLMTEIMREIIRRS